MNPLSVLTCCLYHDRLLIILWQALHKLLYFFKLCASVNLENLSCGHKMILYIYFFKDNTVEGAISDGHWMAITAIEMFHTAWKAVFLF